VALDVASRGMDDAVREARSLGITHEEIRSIADTSIARTYPEEKK
jgi:hypothetical protein